MLHRESPKTMKRSVSRRFIGHSDIRTREKRREREEIPDVGKSEYRRRLAHDWLSRVKDILSGRTILSRARGLVKVPEIKTRPFVPDYEFVSPSVAVLAYPISKSAVQHDRELHASAPTYGTTRLVGVDQLNIRFPNMSGATLRLLGDAGGDFTVGLSEYVR